MNVWNIWSVCHCLTDIESSALMLVPVLKCQNITQAMIQEVQLTQKVISEQILEVYFYVRIVN